jgi:SAM-dependent methyltransferase
MDSSQFTYPMAVDSNWVRYVMDNATYRLIKEWDTANMSVAEISGDQWKDKVPWRDYIKLEYPDFDVCASSFPAKYDIIIAEQVFEHVRHPNRACKNIYSALKPGGLFLITVPFIFHIHPTPLDCWRWTPQGLSFLLQDSGFDVDNIIVDSWGNYECFLRHAIDQTAPWMRDDFPLNNQPHIPQMVWALARKQKLTTD